MDDLSGASIGNAEKVDNVDNVKIKLPNLHCYWMWS
jgi:hypothetical protein